MYSKILVALDGSETSSHALDVALTLASEAGARLHPVYVVDFLVPAYDAPGYDPSIMIEAVRDEGQQVVDDAAKRMAAHGVSGTPQIAETDPVGEDVAQRILTVAAQAGDELIVMGTHGRRGFQRLMLGSVAERLLRSATCPVLIVPAHRAQAAAVEAATTAATTAAAAEKEPS
ncbi:universal stress protein [Burkholderia guangdongensis]|uniref:universal stress protein n=1 Tax=Burkholderia guangdongensis TaxID=1792500 RepID=UPI0015CDB1D4|nr:universal stress protein [Burkholderia guangdongensis]